MLAGPTSTIRTMRRAIARTMGALTVAAKIDLDRTAEDRAFFAAEKEKLVPVAGKLASVHTALMAFDFGLGEELQAGVEIGDKVLDAGVRDGNARTKLGVKGKGGLDATHVFGQRVNELTDKPLRAEPQKVIEAAARLDDLPDFNDKAAIKESLNKRAEQQEDMLIARDDGETDRNVLVSATVKAIMDGANALVATQAELTKRFPRQRSYVASFFFDVASKSSRKKEADDDSEDAEETGGEEAAKPTPSVA